MCGVTSAGVRAIGLPLTIGTDLCVILFIYLYIYIYYFIIVE